MLLLRTFPASDGLASRGRLGLGRAGSHWHLSIRLTSIPYTFSLYCVLSWNAARCFASYLDATAEHLCVGKNVLELGAGGALPGIMAALLGARKVCGTSLCAYRFLNLAPKVVLTDYPDPSLLDNISYNVAQNMPEGRRSCVSVQGYIWGRDTTSLLEALREPDEEGSNQHKFDLLILSDLIFNHAAVRAQCHVMPVTIFGL